MNRSSSNKIASLDPEIEQTVHRAAEAKRKKEHGSRPQLVVQEQDN